MKARQFVWSNPQVQELADNYVAVADELHNLRTGKTSEAKFFQMVFKQKKNHPGHQGVFLATPNGRLLASSTCYDAENVIQLLKQGLKAWDNLSTSARLEPKSKLVEMPTSGRPEDFYPSDGLVLRVAARDLPSTDLASERNNRWHRYYLWFSGDEIRSIVPDQLEPGQSLSFPRDLANRVACLSLLDKGNVDGFTKPFLDKDVEEASITLTVVEDSETEVHFKITGSTATKTADAQAFVSNLPRYEEVPAYRGVKTKILGNATWNRGARKFTSFRMVGVGTRFGGAYVGRTPDDWGVNPIGFSFVLGKANPVEQIAPEFPDRYQWLSQVEANAQQKGAAGINKTINEIEVWFEEPAAPQDGQQLLNSWRNEDAEESSKKIEAAIDKNRGTPLIFGNDLIFLIKHAGKNAPKLVGDFNEWAASDGRFADSGKMQKIGSTDWFFYQVKALPKARFEYAVQIGHEQAADPNNPRTVTTFGSIRSEVVLPGAKVGIGSNSPNQPLMGRLESFEFASEIWKNTREINVYLPPGYSSGEERYPVLYVFDGANWLTEGRLDTTVDQLIQQNLIKPSIIVFVLPVKRAYEYGGNQRFRQMIMEELKPRIESSYRLSSGPDNCAVLGCSRGGLAALDLAFHEPAFGFVAVFAPAIRPLPFLEKLQASNRKPFRVALLECSYDLEELRMQAQSLRDILKEKQYQLWYKTAPINHGYNGWRHYVEDVLIEWIPAEIK